MFGNLFHKMINVRGGLLSNFINLSFIQVSNALLQIFLFPVVLHIVGVTHFGFVLVANSFAGLMSIYINYGTNQSGIKDITLNRENRKEKSVIFFSIIYARLALFFTVVVLLALMYYLNISNNIYYVFASAIIFSEVLNPLFFFIGMEKLVVFNIMNLLSKLVSIILIVFLVKNADDAYLVNLYIGLTAIASYIILIAYGVKRYGLIFILPGLPAVGKLLRENFYLVFNGLSIHLQQSFFLFQLSFTASPLVLGAYSLCDKIVWACRLLISSFSAAIYPRSTLLYQADPEKWKAYKKQLNLLLALVFISGSLILFLFPGQIIQLLTGKRDGQFESYLRIISFTPLIIALNGLNIIDVLLKNAYHMIFKISLIILFISMACSVIMISIDKPLIFAYYPVIIELSCLVVYLLFLRKKTQTVSP